MTDPKEKKQKEGRVLRSATMEVPGRGQWFSAPAGTQGMDSLMEADRIQVFWPFSSFHVGFLWRISADSDLQVMSVL